MMDADIAQRDIVVGNGDCVPVVDVDVEVLDDLAIVGGVNRRGGVSEADRLRRGRRLGLQTAAIRRARLYPPFGSASAAGPAAIASLGAWMTRGASSRRTRRC